jgi:hypothetical protein
VYINVLNGSLEIERQISETNEPIRGKITGITSWKKFACVPIYLIYHTGKGHHIHRFIAFLFCMPTCKSYSEFAFHLHSINLILPLIIIVQAEVLCL